MHAFAENDLAAASPDLLRAMVKTIARVPFAADEQPAREGTVEVGCRQSAVLGVRTRRVAVHGGRRIMPAAKSGREPWW
ncbi:hypothetical protein [Streptomyces wuyuanensis]|uniref:hypothetical protein n=1 Tax=Streptomyces wuyuanensis TaxID=1196353 RepID=UPI0037B93331